MGVRMDKLLSFLGLFEALLVEALLLGVVMALF